jgi:hypothetical protein
VPLLNLKNMDKETRKKIEEFHGWDFCNHKRIRNYCPECSIDVPAFWRKAEMPNLERVGQMELGLTGN